MPKTRQQKETILDELKDRLARAKSLVVSSYGAMTVAQSQELRQLLRNEGAEYVAVKKTLMSVIAKEKPELAIDPRAWKGSIGILFGFQDEVVPAKVLATFQKKNPIIQPIGGLFEGRWITSQEVIALSALPSKQQLRGQLVGLLNAPATGVVNTLNGVMRQLASVVDAIGKAKS